MHPKTLRLPSRPFRALLCSAIVSVAFPALSAAQPTDPPYYLYRGEPIELEVSLEHLSVGLFPGEDLVTRRTLALPTATEELTSTRLSEDIWRVRIGEPAAEIDRSATLVPGEATPRRSAAVPGQKPTVEERRSAATTLRDDVIAALRADPAVEWVYPALRHPAGGTLLFPTPRVVLQAESGVTEARLREILPTGLEVVERLWGTEDQYVIRLTEPRIDHPLDVSVRLSREIAEIAWAEPDFIQDWQRGLVPNDPLFPDQWHLRNTGQGGGVPGADSRAHEAWDLGYDGGGVVVAVLDDGVQLSHPDLEPRLFENPGEIPGNGVDDDNNGFVDDVNGWDFFENDNQPDPDLSGPGSHGTSVAGVAAAAGNNSEGGSGSCPNCRILPVRIAGDVFISDAAIAIAINYAASFADVLNNSWGGGAPSTAIDNAIANATSNGRGGLGSPTLFATGNSASGFIGPFQLNFSGSGTSTYTFEWKFRKDSIFTQGFDTAWLDNVIFPDGALESFEGCSGLPSGWSTGGNATWGAVNDGRRASSTFGGQCSIKAGEIGDSQESWVRVTRTVTRPSTLYYWAWVSSESPSGGPLSVDDGTGSPECPWDRLELNLYDSSGTTLLGTFFESCGFFSNQGNPLQDNVVSYPASNPNSIAVGSATNFDRRSDYSQYGAELDFLSHSNGGSLGITAPDVTGPNGYTNSDYTSSFGGTSAATPHAAGIAALLLDQSPGLTATEVRQWMRDSARQIGPLPFFQRRNDQYGEGVIDAKALLDAAGGIFSDDFELGNTTAWSSTVGG